MRRATRFKAAGAALVLLAGLMVLAPDHARANDDETSYSFGVTPAVAGEPVEATYRLEFGSDLYDELVIHNAPGHVFAHADTVAGVPPTPFDGPRPQDGDVVGILQESTGQWPDHGCEEFTFDGGNEWVWNEPFRHPQLEGQVAELSLMLEAGEGQVVRIVRSEGDDIQDEVHYDYVVIGTPEVCEGSGWAGVSTSLATARTASGAETDRVFQRNPPEPGTYRNCVTYRDLTGEEHERCLSYAKYTADDDVEPGGTLTTDEDDQGTSADDPLQTAVTTPTGGQVSISQGIITREPPAGFQLFGEHQVEIDAPDASPEDPLALTFTLDASIIPVGNSYETVEVFRNGELVESCTGPESHASPDPCVDERVDTGDGGARISVLTSQASDWTFGGVIPPHVVITDVENQHVDTHARDAGDTLAFEGPSWPEDGTVDTVELCADPDGSGDCHPLDALAATVDADGVLTGSGDVPPSVAAEPGEWFLRAEVDGVASDDETTEEVSLLIVLDDPTLTLSPVEGGVGTMVTLGGAGWNPLADTDVRVTDPDDGTSGTAEIDANGVLSGSWEVAESDADLLDDEEDETTLTLTAMDVDDGTSAQSSSAEFEVLDNEVELESGEDGLLLQIVESDLEGDTLVFEQEAAVIEMGALTIDGTDQQSIGELNQVTVNERRGTLEGWEIYGHLQTDLLQPGQDADDPDPHRSIPAASLTWTPECHADTSAEEEIITGPPASLEAPTLLCQGDPGGGITTGDAGLVLEVPATQAAGHYTAVLQLDLISGGSL